MDISRGRDSGRSNQERKVGRETLCNLTIEHLNDGALAVLASDHSSQTVEELTRLPHALRLYPTATLRTCLESKTSTQKKYNNTFITLPAGKLRPFRDMNQKGHIDSRLMFVCMCSPQTNLSLYQYSIFPQSDQRSFLLNMPMLTPIILFPSHNFFFTSSNDSWSFLTRLPFLPLLFSPCHFRPTQKSFRW